MTVRALMLAAARVAGAVLPNAALLVVLTHLNHAESVDADPAVVARLRLAAPPVAPPPPRELEPKEEPEQEPEVVDVAEPVPPETPVADIEPLALPTVALACSVPVMVRPIPAVVRPSPRRVAGTGHHPARRPPRSPRTLGADEVEQPPRELQVRQPVYPDSARRFGIQGSATVRLLIDEKGRVAKVELVDSKGSRLFGRAVLEVACGWRFTPARDHGRNVRVWAVKTVRFRLKGSP